MERIEALIEQLKKQFEQNASPAQLLGTVQLLQFELTKLNSGGQHSLGTAKVAVVLPVAPGVVKQEAPAITPELEKYAPKPAELAQPVTKEEKKTILVDEGSVSVIQKNGQLDMGFDPMKEIPTLSSQVPGKEVNDLVISHEESLNEKLKQPKTEIVEVLKETPVKDLRKAIGINDRFLYINELFRGDENMYERCIKTINNFNIYAEAEYWINRELKVKLGWNNDNEVVKQFDQLVRRRFS
ncbi:MAG TPA: hypothetical protein PKA77_11375 [Chitinophagaceae bacterium]|jgi:hypothetical protein|nr:hypothetical protein [Chitinophagaceae bacterium]HMU58218.1 hypothetical protein [Chitinophagaceae bacterium]